MAVCFDHIPPVCFYPSYQVSRRRKGAKQLDLPGVHACQECNSGLSDKMLLTLQERALYLYGWLKKRYAALIAMPEWSLEELAELEPSLRQSVLEQLKQKAWVNHRLAVVKFTAHQFPEADESVDKILPEHVLDEI